MAITYTVKKCKGNHYGVYVKAISGDELQTLRPLFPEIEDHPDITCIQVSSARIARKATPEAANKVVARLKSLSRADQVDRLWNLDMSLEDKDFVAEKFQYFRVNWKFGPHNISPFTTQDKERAEKLAMEYAESGTPSHLTRTVSRTVKGNEDKIAKMRERGETKTVHAYGLVGMQKPLKDQGPEMLRRISQRRKNTTSLNFWAKR